MSDGKVQGDAGAHAVAENISLGDPKVPERCGGVIGQLLDGERAIDVGRASMGLQLEGDDLPSLGKSRQKLSERRADCRKRAVEQNQRRSGAVDLVIHLQIVLLSVAASPRGPSIVAIRHVGLLLTRQLALSGSSIRQ